MAKTNILPMGLTERLQLIAFSWSPDNAGIIKPRLNIGGEWVQQADLPAGALIACRSIRRRTVFAASVLTAMPPPVMRYGSYN